MRTGLALGICSVLVASQCAAWHMRAIPLTQDDAGRITRLVWRAPPGCALDYYYLLEDCGYVTVLESIDVDRTFGVHFSMTDTVAWHDPCDTSACQTLDVLELTFYDVLPPPNDQDLNVSIYAADASGEPVGPMLGNCDFIPYYVDTAAITVTEIDFTNDGQEAGLDLSGSGGDFVVLVTWKNSTEHPALVLDNISTCVDSCSVNVACCDMGLSPYIYPRPRIHAYDYGYEGAWSKQDSFPDVGGEGTYGYLEALWACSFCSYSAAARPATWGAIKALYR